MKSVFDKLREIGLGSVHGVLDGLRKSEVLSLPIAEQNLRDLIAQRDKVDQSVTSTIASIQMLTKEQSERAKRITKLESTMTHILTDDDPNNDAAAEPLMAEKLQIESARDRAQVELDDHTATRAVLEQALGMINSRASEVQAQIDELRSTEHTAAAKSAAKTALQNARQILEKAPGAELDSTLAAARRRGAEADVGLQREMSKIGAATNSMARNAEVGDALAKFKAGLAKKDAAAA